MTALTLHKPTFRVDEIAPLTVEQYHRMVDQGILDEGDRIELLEGVLLWRDEGEGMTIKPRHAVALDQVALALAPLLAGRGCYLRTQNPVTLSTSDEPQPDAAIVVGRPSDFLERHPGPSEVAVVIEVAESSLDRDRGLKLRAYARAGIPQYLVLNLKSRLAEIYEGSEPTAGTYREVRLCHPGERLRLLLPSGERIELGAEEILL